MCFVHLYMCTGVTKASASQQGFPPPAAPVPAAAAVHPDRPDADKLSLGAVFGVCEPSPGHYSPSQQIPYPWRAAFATRMCDDDMFDVLWRASKAMRAFVRQCGPAKLRLDLRRDRPPAEWAQQLSAAAQRLHGRGLLHNEITLQCSHSQSSASRLALVPAALQPVGMGVRVLTVAYDAGDVGAQEQNQTQLPHLTSLTLQHCPCALPTAQLRSLTALTVTVSESYRRSAPPHGSSIRALMPQVVTLALSIAGHTVDTVQRTLQWGPVFSPAPTDSAYPLRSFITTCVLTNELVELLLTHTPALTHLEVGCVGIDERHAAREWGVGEVTVRSSVVDARSMAGLPRYTGGKVEWRGVREISVHVSDADEVSVCKQE